jgi:glycosyltransferase involved in cell wall biosynthesis
MLLSIIIPAYNEQERIGRSLGEILSFISSQPYQAEVIVVDDGSTDQTPRILEECSARYAAAGFELRVLTNRPNRGKGYSVKRGIQNARGQIALFTDADLSSPITEAPKLLEPILSDEADIVFGSRALDRSLIGIRQPLLRDWGGRAFNLAMRLITGLSFKDTQCGFKAFSRQRALPVFSLQSIDGFGFDPEILYIARKRGLRLLEVPVAWNHSRGSKVKLLRDPARMLSDLIRIRLNDLAGRYEKEKPALGEP